MNARELHRQLKKRIIEAQLNNSDLKAVEAYLDDENKYYELLAACFTRLSNKWNQLFIDVLKSKDKSSIENEYLGFLLHLANKDDQFKHLPQEDLNEETFYKLSYHRLKHLKKHFECEDLLRFLGNDINLKKYVDWLNLSNSYDDFLRLFARYYNNNEVFLSLVFSPQGRIYLDSLLNLTFERQDLVGCANFALQCYSFHDKKLNEKVLTFSNALSDLAHGKLDEIYFKKFYSATVELDNLLQQELYAQQIVEKGNNMSLRLGLLGLVLGASMAALTAGFVGLVLILSCVVGGGLVAMPLILLSLSPLLWCAATILFVDTLYRSKEDAPTLAKEFLNEGQRYGQFFKEKSDSAKKDFIVEEPLMDCSYV